MKKLFCFLLIFVMLVPCFAVQAEETPIRVIVNGKPLSFDVPPMLIQDRTMVPLRAIFEALGAKVDYEDVTKKITASLGDTVVTLRVDTPAMYVNNSEYMLDVPATVIDGRTLVPVRAVSEAFKCQVSWDGDTNTVLIARQSEIVKPSNPTVSFSYGDSVKLQLHFNTRKNFEGKVFPGLLFDNQDIFKQMMRDTKEEATKVIDEQIWLPSMDDAIASYLLSVDKDFKKLSNDDAIAKMDETADEYELWPHQNYTVDLFELNATDSCLIVNLADISKVPFNSKEQYGFSPYIALVYDASADRVRFFRCVNDSLVECTAVGKEKDHGIFCSNKSELLTVLTRLFASKRTAVTVKETESVPNTKYFTTYVYKDSDGAMCLLLNCTVAVRDVTFYSLTSEETAYDTQIPLFFFESLSPEKRFVAQVVFEGDMYTYGLSFTDSEGSYRFFVLEISGEDGSMSMKEIFAQ